MIESEVETTDWHDDPNWVLVAYDPDRYSPDDLTKPTRDAELCQPPVWASLYDGRKILATWWRPKAPTPPRATVEPTPVVE